MDWKKALYEKVAPHIGAQAIFASNTSGLSINALAEACPASLRSRFCGIHFFNPPRYMHLVELIAQKDTDVDPARSTGNLSGHDARQGRRTRQGHAQFRRQSRRRVFDAGDDGAYRTLRAGLRRGRRIDRPGDRAREERDLSHRRRRRPRHAGPRHPDHGRDAARRSVARLLSVAGVAEGAHCQGCAGTKDRRRACSRKSARISRSSTSRSRPIAAPKARSIQASRRSLRSRIRPKNSPGCARSDHPQAQFLWSIFRDLFHYAAYHLASIADNARDVDLAIRWGFGWQMGPFETWQAAGMETGRAMDRRRHRRGQGAGQRAAARLGQRGAGKRRRTHARRRVLARRPTPLCPARPSRYTSGNISRIRSSARNGRRARRSWRPMRVRMWHTGDDIAIVSFKSKSNTIGEDVLDGMLAAIAEAEKNWRGLVIWQTREPFSFGANLGVVRCRGAGGTVGCGRGGRRQVPAYVAAPEVQPDPDRRRRRAAWHSAARANSSCIAIARWRRWSRTSAWSRPAWACCRGAAAARSWPSARRRKSRAGRMAARSIRCHSCARIFSRSRWRRSPGARWRPRISATCDPRMS